MSPQSQQCPDGYEPIESRVEEISIGIQTDPVAEYDASVVDIAVSVEDRVDGIVHDVVQDAECRLPAVADVVEDIVQESPSPAVEERYVESRLPTATVDPVTEGVKPEVDEVKQEVDEVKPEVDGVKPEVKPAVVWSAETSPDDDDPAGTKQDRPEPKKTCNGPKTNLGN